MGRSSFVLMAVAVGAAVLPSTGCSQSKEQGTDLFKDCREAGAVAGKLKEAYAAFAAAARAGKVERFCLPHAVTVSTTARPEKNQEYGQDMNLPFLKSRFSAAVLSARQDSDDCFLLRTGTTALGFVETKSGEWRIYHYLDKPME